MAVVTAIPCAVSRKGRRTMPFEVLAGLLDGVLGGGTTGGGLLGGGLLNGGLLGGALDSVLDGVSGLLDGLLGTGGTGSGS
ncbi:hypothetical protein HQ325_12950 [Rhodococcus sp. BP-349]|uniref:hypothetical protein n=1 Tax=unclassified Rhodococcus (in: high G+C Gram-positive bacteria) TaxID=192944 RepID=UPI001C9A3F36|nr:MULTISPECIES: hypothetical protein [unclassified Rhodococcus (in: high G+C Gram-positive bacteria)]MBY6539583.1 hypothetical protein [Rhodococcus sp. BP-363]MBY6544089.1 hypothetical protein [Rhodococcus sp. BP-369]MBY6563319.1 hypothetical protein [Rhodococcus sp. BP-370]MBY6577611.1 hypothetical protein [Rhodococcus sp. BP-364]MBY6586912.1 hypothetical protein [Rhodococcus sp. BP-358]